MASDPTGPCLSGPQCRAARALLRWSQDDLAARTGVSKATILYFELGERRPYVRTLEDLRRVLTKAGVIFIESGENGGEGVCLRL